jgi:hypothetical protein
LRIPDQLRLINIGLNRTIGIKNKNETARFIGPPHVINGFAASPPDGEA